MKQLSTLLFLLLALAARGQQGTFEAIVVDARNGQPLPFASIYINKVSSTISNAEGRFLINADSADVLNISYVGYKPQRVRAARLGGRVGLEAMEMGLQEVTVNPIGPIIRKTTKETLRQLQKFKKKTSSFFYRQIAFADTTCYEFAEAFLTGRSAAWLRDLELITGRFAGIQGDSVNHFSFYGNFYTFSEIEVASKSRELPGFVDVLPLSRNYLHYYDVDYEVIRDSNENRLFAIHFTPKPEIRQSILDVTLYIDEQTCCLRKMEGVGRNTRILHRELAMKDSVPVVVAGVFPTEFSFVVNMTEERGFLEVQSVFVDESHVFADKQIVTRSILFNVGDRKLGRGEEMKFYGNLHKNIRQQGYDATFWHNNETVLRTPVEQQVMEIFERENLFGVFK
jgi:hypothetical protein